MILIKNTHNYQTMDLTQKKLSKSEWMNIEVLVSDEEKHILRMIIDGYYNVNIRSNSTLTLRTTMKLDANIKNIDEYLYQEYFEKIIEEMNTKFCNILNFNDGEQICKTKTKKIKLKSGELIRVNSIDKKLDIQRAHIFEYVLLDFMGEILKSLVAGTDTYAFYLYTLLQIKKSTIYGVNEYVVKFVDIIIQQLLHKVHMNDVLTQSYQFIEKNHHLLKYADKILFDHQKQIYISFRYRQPAPDDTVATKLEYMSTVGPKLVLYTAPTGTGKTLTPLGLSVGHRIIFICAARHVGLALAKSAVSMNKRIAIAFGCETPDDIRLHYYAASEFSINKRTGGIRKVDNSVGDKVDIMICDVQSYIIAMRYMLAFTPEYEGDMLIDRDTDIISYWDEPTISMDYDDHPLHATIQNVWRENQISKMVLSCATLPHEDEIMDVLSGFRNKFPGAAIETITSYDCRKSIAVLNQEGKSVLPHTLCNDFVELQNCVQHCIRNKTLLRYFDLVEVSKFLHKVNNMDGALEEQYKMSNYFDEGITSITMNSIKLYYLCVLQNINPIHWSQIYEYLKLEQTTKFPQTIHKIKSYDNGHSSSGKQLMRTNSVNSIATTPQIPLGISITTKDAHTLTDGPSIYLSDNVENLGKFYIMNSKIPERVFKMISENIADNNVIQQKLSQVEQQIADFELSNENKETSADSEDMKKYGKKNDGKKNDRKFNRETPVVSNNKLYQMADLYRSQIKPVNLDQLFIPNTETHQSIWVKTGKEIPNAFIPRISDDDVCNIMALDVDNDKKILLLLGIGMFVDEKTANPRYIEIMKRLADEQHLFVILASSDYIYGTNYQFCHGFIGKDLKNMTQQKTIQAMGRIGRNHMQQEYTVRFRDNDMLYQLFQPPIENKEAIVMSRLFQ